MPKPHEPSKSLSPENQALIECPVFHTDVKIASCFQLRDLVWRGEQIPVRKGCQVAMHANKCPINHILKRMLHTGEDNYHAATPTKKQLDPEILQRIAPILIQERDIERADLSGPETQRLQQANEDASPMTSHSKPRRRRQQAVATEVAESAAKTAAADQVIAAAASGDLTQAINTPEAP